MMLADTFHRPLRDLRVSVTDRCNMRCTYCMPKEHFGSGYNFLRKKALLTYEEITRLVQIFVSLGVEKVRITGGEPLLRKNLDSLLLDLSSLRGLRDLTLTTNGLLLKRYAKGLKDAGLKRITISLDSLDQREFEAINGVESRVKDVLEGIREAHRVGLKPVKINSVIKKGVNEGAIIGLASFFRGTGCILRFIEYMDVGNTNQWRMDEVMPVGEILKVIDAYYPLQALEENYRGEVARRWEYCDGEGEIGMISSVSHPFCGDCSRARLSPEGRLYTCLFSSQGYDLRKPLRQGADDEELRNQVIQIWKNRSDRYSEQRDSISSDYPRVEMSHIGG